MREEVSAAVIFVTRMVKKNKKLTQDQVENFSNKLTTLLHKKFKDHWYREKPFKGQAYRCLRVNDCGVDPVLIRAAQESGLSYRDLNLPTEMTLWVDPQEVCCRFGELCGSYCVVAHVKNGKLDNKAHDIDVEGLVHKHEKRQQQELDNRERRLKTRQNHFNRLNSPNHLSEYLAPHSPNHHMQEHNRYVDHYHNQQDYAQQAEYDTARCHTPPSNTQLNANAKTFRSTYSPPGFSGSYSPNSAEAYHWARGADLVKS